MWTPPSKYTLPSNQDVQATKAAISKLEAHLMVAMEALEQAHKATDNLEQEISERKRWIAPARLLPHDILSIIILEACKQDSNVPFTFGSVCRTWRASALDTPRAWTYIHLSRIKSIDGMRIILDRSATTPLHLNISRSNFRVSLIEELVRNIDRVICLKLSYEHTSVLRYPLSNLTKLVFVGASGPMLSMGNLNMSLDGTKFPRLRSLTIELDGRWSYPLPTTEFPPIEELAIRTDDSSIAAFIIKNLALNLILLRVHLASSRISYEPSKITFPQLRHLSILDSRLHSGSCWPFDADTPVLESYEEEKKSIHMTRNTHKDTRLVKQLSFDIAIDLRLFPRLCRVAASEHGIRSLLSVLQKDPRSFPDLKVIHCERSGEIESRIDAFNLLNGRNLTFTPYAQGDTPDFFEPFRFPLVCILSPFYII